MLGHKTPRNIKLKVEVGFYSFKEKLLQHFELSESMRAFNSTAQLTK